MTAGKRSALLHVLRAYRVCKTRHLPFDGSGATIHGGRWNSPGRSVIYAAMSFSGALLEILAHAGRDRLPGAHHVVTIDIPATIPVLRISESDVPGWNFADAEAGRAFGDRWIAEGKTAVLIVPSAIATPHESNVVINPHHPDVAHLQISAPAPVRWDPRLFPGASLSGPY